MRVSQWHVECEHWLIEIRMETVQDGMSQPGILDTFTFGKFAVSSYTQVRADGAAIQQEGHEVSVYSHLTD